MAGLIYYFAFGSNMNPERVVERGLKVKNQVGAVLYGYRLEFNKRNQRSLLTGHANIEYAPARMVEGVLYELSSELEILKMDPFEKAPINYGREAVSLRTDVGPCWAWTYFANPALKGNGLLPERSYMAHLLKGKPYISQDYFSYLENHEVLEA